ncbi:MAG: hypothetical protein ACR2PL_13105 [Dehalococcoidia bacterium]
MPDLSIDDETDGELDEAEVAGRLLHPADQRTPEAVEPRLRGLDRLPARRKALGGAGRGQRL